MYNKIAQLRITPGKNSGSVGDIFIAQPDAVKEALAGKLFILIEISVKNSNGIKIVNYLIDNINYNYYQNEKIYLRERISALKVEHIFEATLAKVNKNFNEYIKNEKIKLDPDLINITVGLIYKNELYFTNTGKNKALLLYRVPGENKNCRTGKKNTTSQKYGNKETAGSEISYKISDISEQASSDDGANSLLGGAESGSNRKYRLFSNVISGQIPKHGYFIISNESLPEYVSPWQLIRIITNIPPLSAVEQIKNILSKINSFVSFWGVIIKNTQFEKSEEPTPSCKPTGNASILDLNKTEEKTENLLTPSGIINIKKLLSFSKNIISGNNRKIQIPKSDMTIKDKIIVKRSSFSRKLLQAIKNFAGLTLNLFFYLFKQLTNKKRISSLSNNISKGVKNTITALPNTLNKKSKILLVVAVLFLIIFVINLSFTRTKNKKEEVDKNYKDLALLIEQKQNQAEANLLYSNEEGAKKLFDEIDDMMEGLPRLTEEQKKKFAQFKEKFEFQLEKIRRVTRIDEPVEVADFINLTTKADPDNLVFAPDSNKIYAADSSQKSIYILDIAENLITTVASLEDSIQLLLYPAVTETGIYYYNKTNIFNLDTNSEELGGLNITLEDNSGYVGSDTYNNRLYMLNSKDNQIYRHNRNGSEFSPAYSWVQEKLELSDAVDISIDGHIYILLHTGEIIKTLRGTRVEFKLEIVEPPLKEVSKLIVSPEDRFIYILEPKAARLVIYDKTGQFLMQYASKAFTDIKDFAVDEKNKLIYFLNGTKVLKIEAVHFEE